MSELLNSQPFLIFFLLCVAISCSIGYKIICEADFNTSGWQDSIFFTIFNAAALIIALVSIVWISIVGEWWYSLVMIGAGLLIAPIVSLAIPLTATILTYFIGSYKEVWISIITILMEAVFSVWMIVALFQM